MKTTGFGFTLTALAFALGMGAAQAHSGHTAPAADNGKPNVSDVKKTPAAGVPVAEREAKARNYFTDTKLKSSDGREMRFFSDVLKDRLVLINFVYTNCGDACPMIVHNLTLAKKELGEEFGRDVRFVSLSIDPERDTPAQLAQFAKKFDATHPEWIFLTGKKAEMDAILKKMGAFTEDPKEHFTGMFIGNLKTDTWRKMRPNTPPVAIAEEIRRVGQKPLAAAAR